MGYGYSKRRTDNNHKELITDLRKEFGDNNVLDTHTLPKFCDAVLGFQGRTYLIEIKTTKKSKLTKDEKIIHENFVGAYIIATCVDDVKCFVYADNPPF